MGRFWSVAGLVCGIAALFSILILSAGSVVFGLLGFLFGFLGYRRGDRGLGLTAMFVSSAGLVVGVLLILLFLFIVLGLPAITGLL